MNVLLIGAGGREHALAWAISSSPLLTKLFCAPGNPGIAQVAQCVPLDPSRHDVIIGFCRDARIDLVIIGPEAPLVAGLADALGAYGIRCFGPSKAAAELEGSKGFTKDLCREAGIPTASYGRFMDRNSALAYLRSQRLPIVIKADGLAAGKGVIIAATREEAEAAVDTCLSGGFGSAGTEIVIEEFLEGEEASFFALCDGNTAVPFASAQDHKRANDGDTGPNTGGMGAYSPAPIMTQAMADRVMSEIVLPTVDVMRRRGTPFKGVLFAGLMITGEGPKLIEYNVRFGDPETQALMMRLDSDLLGVLLSTSEGRLTGCNIRWRDEAALVVVLAAEGYPGPPRKGTPISGLAQAAATPGVEIFHAGTRVVDGVLVADGGRVLNVAARGKTVAEARQRAYAAIGKIVWPEGFYRKDIGWRALARDEG